MNELNGSWEKFSGQINLMMDRKWKIRSIEKKWESLPFCNGYVGQFPQMTNFLILIEN